MKNIYFSVVIPTLNEEMFLPKLLGDLEKQKDKDFETIIVDGHSVDNTKKEGLKFAKKLKLSFYTVKKRNISHQRNFGAERARGKYLVFMDADIRINNSFMSMLKMEIEKYRYLVFLPSFQPYGDKKPLFQMSNFLIEVSQHLNKPVPTPGLMIFENNFFNLIGQYTEKDQHKKSFFPEDHDILFRVYKSGVRAKFLNKVRYKISLRRMENEGFFNYLKKITTSTIQMSVKGEVDHQAFDYEMGGHIYKKRRKSKAKPR